MSDRKLATAVDDELRRTWYNEFSLQVSSYYSGGGWSGGSSYGTFDTNIDASKLDDDLYEINIDGKFLCYVHKNKGLLEKCKKISKNNFI